MKRFAAFLLVLCCSCVYGQAVPSVVPEPEPVIPTWKPAYTAVDHSDRISSPLQPQPLPIWLIEQNPGASRWNHRGPMYPPLSHRSQSHAKHLKVGSVVSTRFTMDPRKLDLPKNGDWNLFEQFHGKNGTEDSQVGQVSISLRRDTVPTNWIPDGQVWWLGVHGDNKEVTQGGKWANKRYRAIPFTEQQVPITWYVRMRVGGDGVTPAEDGVVYPKGLTVFYWQTAEMDAPVEVWYVEGPNYFPWLGKPDAGAQLPTFGSYRGKTLLSKQTLIYMWDIAVAYEPEFNREPVFNFDQ